MSEWQLIDTAPRDRFLILRHPSEWLPVSLGYYDNEGGCWVIINDEGGWQWLDDSPPDAWVPLPGPSENATTIARRHAEIDGLTWDDLDSLDQIMRIQSAQSFLDAQAALRALPSVLRSEDSANE